MITQGRSKKFWGVTGSSWRVSEDVLEVLQTGLKEGRAWPCEHSKKLITWRPQWWPRPCLRWGQ